LCRQMLMMKWSVVGTNNRPFHHQHLPTQSLPSKLRLTKNHPLTHTPYH